MSSMYKGLNLDFTIFGESHGRAIGGCINGLPYGFEIDIEYIDKFMERRRPSKMDNTTSRRERDEVVILSGIKNNKILNSPIAFIIENKDQKSKDYSTLYNTPRPSHVDYVGISKYKDGIDLDGGGHFSGRLTAPLTFIGGICKKILEDFGINIYSHIYKTQGFTDLSIDKVKDIDLLNKIKTNKYPIIDESKINDLDEILKDVRLNHDSLGAIVETSIMGLPLGLGAPIFDGMENNISKIMFSIPGVKGIEFGSGFLGSLSLGSENNDEYKMIDSKVTFTSNNSGGILGGLSTGETLNFKLAFKPTPSIFKEQNSVNLKNKEDEKLKIVGRHDPMIALRGVPVVEALSAIIILDFLLEEDKFLILKKSKGLEDE